MPGSLFEGIVKMADELSGTSWAEPIRVPLGLVVVVVSGVVVVVLGVVVGVSGVDVVVVVGVIFTGVVVVVVVDVPGSVRTRADFGFGASPISAPISAAAPPSMRTPAAAAAAVKPPKTKTRRSM